MVISRSSIGCFIALRPLIGNRHCLFCTDTLNEKADILLTLRKNQAAIDDDDRKMPHEQWWRGMDTSMHKNTIHVLGRLADFAPRKVKIGDRFGLHLVLVTNTWHTYPGGSKAKMDERHSIRTNLMPDESTVDKLMQEICRENGALLDIRGHLLYQVRRGKLMPCIEANNVTAVSDQKNLSHINSVELIGLVKKAQMGQMRSSSSVLHLQVNTITAFPVIGETRQMAGTGPNIVCTRHDVNMYAIPGTKLTKQLLDDLNKSIKKGSTVSVYGSIIYKKVEKGITLANINADDVRIWSDESALHSVV